MSTSVRRRSPVQMDHEVVSVTDWIEFDSGTLPGIYSSTNIEQAARNRLAICDLSLFPRIVFKGPKSEAWLKSHGLAVPKLVYEWRDMGMGTLIIRTGPQEFLIEDSPGEYKTSELSACFTPNETGVYRADRQDAEFALSGLMLPEVLCRICSLNTKELFGKFVFSQVIGINCAMLYPSIADIPLVRIWVDYTYGRYVWKQLLSLIQEFDGEKIGIRSMLQNEG